MISYAAVFRSVSTHGDISKPRCVKELLLILQESMVCWNKSNNKIVYFKSFLFKSGTCQLLRISGAMCIISFISAITRSLAVEYSLRSSQQIMWYRGRKSGLHQHSLSVNSNIGEDAYQWIFGFNVIYWCLHWWGCLCSFDETVSSNRIVYQSVGLYIQFKWSKCSVSRKTENCNQVTTSNHFKCYNSLCLICLFFLQPLWVIRKRFIPRTFGWKASLW